MLSPLGLDQGDDRAAEAAARHPRGERARLERGSNERVERRRRNLVVVAEARVACCEDRAERQRIALFERSDCCANALVLGVDVAHASWVAGFELAATVAVTGPFVGVPLAGIEHEECDVIRKRHPAVVERPAIEEEGGPCTSEQRGGLVEDA